MNRYALIAVILSATMSAGAAEGKPKKRRATKDEVSATLRLLPARRPAGRREYYSVPESTMKEFKGRVAALNEKVDIVPAVAERIKKLDPSTEENEAELVNLVSILEMNPDPRALAALDHAASLKSPTVVYMRDGDMIIPYNYAEPAKELAQAIRIRVATEAWQRELARLPEAERVERITRYVWGIENNTDEPKRRAAANLLRELNPDIWWPRLVAQLPDLNAQDETSLRKTQYMPYWISVGITKGKSDPSIDAFIQQAAASKRLEDWASDATRKQKK